MIIEYPSVKKEFGNIVTVSFDPKNPNNVKTMGDVTCLSEDDYDEYEAHMESIAEYAMMLEF